MKLLCKMMPIGLKKPICFILILGLSYLPNYCNALTASMSGSAKPFALNVKIVVKPERREEFITVIKNDQKQTLATEPDALQFVIGEDIDQQNTFYLHEQYTSTEGLDAHTKTSHFAAWQKFGDTDPFVSEPEIDTFDCTHKPEKIADRSAFCLNVELCINPDVREEFLNVIENNQNGSNNKEPLCLQYHYGESNTVPNTFYFHEQYTGLDGGKEGFDAHTNAPHFAAWEEFASTNPFTKDPIVYKYKTI